MNDSVVKEQPCFKEIIMPYEHMQLRLFQALTFNCSYQSSREEETEIGCPFQVEVKLMHS